MAIDFSKLNPFHKKAFPCPKEGEFSHLSPDLNEGLTDQEVERQKRLHLVNAVTKKYSKSYLNIVVSNVFTIFNVLAVIVAVALALAHANLSQFFFLAIFTLNAVIGIIQEIRSKIKIDKLTILSSPTATVLRGGKEVKIPTEEIVVDDVILLTTGQQVPVDCLFCTGNAEVNESLLTGESHSVTKKNGDKLFAGSYIAAGGCKARVVTVGDNTYVSGLTAKAKKYKRPHSEIMSSINAFVKVIVLLMIPITVGTLLINYYSQGAEKNFAEAVQATGAVVIGMIPSGMILLSSTAMAVGIYRMAKQNTLVQDMYSLEMLARIDTLCLDKTGTITDGRMKLQEIAPLTENYNVEKILGNILTAQKEDNQTSLALRAAFPTRQDMAVSAVLPFSSLRKYSAVSFTGEGSYLLGAPDFVLPTVTEAMRLRINDFAQKGLRVLLLAHTPQEMTGGEEPSRENITPVALFALSDHVRDDAKQTIEWFYENDVAIKVISGDDPVTVSCVAANAGVKNADKYISLEGLSDKQIEEYAGEYTVFGRVQPEQKSVLIKALKALGHKVAMTGDGVNDILAMKEADCAIAMASGSEAATSVANLVLTDNNFSHMPGVVYEGRRVINNVKNTAVLYIMKTFFTALLATLCIIIGTKYFFKTNNMLCFEGFVAGIPSVILSFQPNKDRLTGKFFSYVLCHAIPAALMMVAVVITMYITSMNLYGRFTEEYQALAVIALTFTGVILLSFVCRPFNALRIFTLCLSAALCAMLFFTPMVYIVLPQWDAFRFSSFGLILMLSSVAAAYPLSYLLFKLFDRLQKVIDRKK